MAITPRVAKRFAADRLKMSDCVIRLVNLFNVFTDIAIYTPLNPTFISSPELKAHKVSL